MTISVEVPLVEVKVEGPVSTSVVVEAPSASVVVEAGNPAITVEHISADVSVEAAVAAPIAVETRQVDVFVDTYGSPGQKGDKGDQGDPGPPGPSDLAYKHTQAMPLTTWVVQHDMGRRPSVHAEDAAGTVIHGSVVHMSDNLLLLSFRMAITGTAYCD